MITRNNNEVASAKRTPRRIPKAKLVALDRLEMKLGSLIFRTPEKRRRP
jgi:hypothetical protein